MPSKSQDPRVSLSNVGFPWQEGHHYPVPRGLQGLGSPWGELGQEMGSLPWQAPAKWTLAKGLRECDRAQGHLMGEDVVRTEGQLLTQALQL